MIDKHLQHPMPLPFMPLHELYGRDDAFAELMRRLQTNPPVWLSGGIGVGKRTLASFIAEQYLQAGQSVVWLTVYHDDFNMMAERLCRIYKCTTESLNAETYTVLKQKLQDDAPLLIIGGISTNNDLFTVRMVLDTCVPNIPTLLISNIVVGNDDNIALGSIALDAAEALYRKVGQIDETRRTALLAPLLNYVDGWPFALHLAGLQHRTVGANSSHFASLLPQTPPGPQSRSLGVIDAAFRLLDNTTQGFLLLLGALFADHSRIDFLESVSGLSPEKLAELLNVLTQRGFVSLTDEPKPTVHVHDMIRLYARRRLQAANQLADTRSRIMQGVLRFVLKYSQAASGENYDALEHAADQIYGAMRLANHLQDTKYTNTIVTMIDRNGVDSFVRSRGYHAWYRRLKQLAGQTENNTSTEHHFALRTALVRVDEPTQTAQSGAVGESLDNLLLELSDARGKGDTYRIARIALTIGDWHTNRDQLKEAVGFYQECAENANPQRDYDLFVRGILATAQAHVELEQPFEALTRIGEGMQYIPLQSADRGRLLAVAGDARMVLSDDETALTDYQQAAMLLENHRALIPAGITMGKAAAIFMDHGEYQSASVLLAQAADAFERANRPDLQGQALGNLGAALGYMGRWREAGRRHMMALQIAQELHDTDEARYQLGNLAFVSETEGYLDWAVHYGRQALHLSLQLDDRASIARHATDLGRLLMMNPPMTQQAVALLEAALHFDPQPHSDALLGQARQLLLTAQQRGFSIYPAQDIESFARASDDTS